MLKERTLAGLNAARKEGRIGGRPPKLKLQQQQEIVKLVTRGKKTAAEAARLFGVHPATVSRLLRKNSIGSLKPVFRSAAPQGPSLSVIVNL
ncbi:MAG: helix-turn-helix domain-containing protein [Bdellovibrionia bacterium]